MKLFRIIFKINNILALLDVINDNNNAVATKLRQYTTDKDFKGDVEYIFTIKDRFDLEEHLFKIHESIVYLKQILK